MPPLTPEQIRRRQELTFKMNNGTITQQEAQELRGLLELEQREATASNDIIALLAIGALLVIVLAFLGDGGRRRRRR
jgi:uncharacterized membrane protein